MAEQLPMILPQGIVVNSNAIYAAVAEYPVIPPDKIHRCWKVFTTTSGKLIDPTAIRLENFWWHVWGSDRKLLSGPTLARLFEDISTGPTFVPLKGPPNRVEKKPTSRPKASLSQHESDDPLPTIAPSSGSQHQSRPPGRPSQNLTPSSSRPPPSHPILKKPRGPSKSGPRPTTRFVSPPQSGEDTVMGSEEVSSGSSSAKRSETRSSTGSASPAKTEKRPITTKKFVVSTAASKKRPVLPRRQSSQSSTGSDVVARESGSSGSRHTSPPRLIPPVAENSTRNQNSKPQSDAEYAAILKEETEAHPPMSAKAAGKRPMLKPSPEKHSHAKSSHPPARPRQPITPQSKAPKATAKDMKTKPEIHTRDGLKKQGESETLVVPQKDNTAPPMLRSRSNNSSFRSTSGPITSQSFIASSTVGTSNVAVTGRFDFETPSAQLVDKDAVPPRRADEPDLQLPSFLDLNSLKPTPPNPAPAPPLGRSKSQLTLLLERDKALISDLEKSTSWKG